MQKFLLMFAVFFGFLLSARAQNANAGPKASAPVSAHTATAPAQPIAFNHELHIQTAKMTCNDCHEPRGDGSTLALPQAPKCMKCHIAIATEKPDIKRLAEAAKNEDPILWVRVYRIPSFVTFSHKTHEGNKCEECHGPVAERTVISQEKEMNMGSCIGCHQAKGAPATCDTCHAIMSFNRRPLGDVPGVMAYLGLERVQKPEMMASISDHVMQSHARSNLALIGNFLNAPMLQLR